MVNNAAKVEAFRSFYLQAKSLYNEGNKDESKDLFLKAASLANDISISSTNYQIRMEYHSQAEKILNFLKYGFNKVPVNNETKEELSTNFEVVNSEDKKITFKDVAGLDDVKEEIIFNVIEPIKNPSLASSYQIEPGAKIMLYGPPGTGKTFIARAIAGEIDAAFYAINCQDLISKYVGESSKLIDKLFKEAESHKKAIIFFDEFDSIAAKRESGGEADQEMARFVASFLTKVDGFKKKNDNEMLLLIAATNRPWAIDKAMLRGGRFDTHIYVGLPDLEARKFLINKELKGLKLDYDVSLNKIASDLENYGGADIVSACSKIKSLAYRRAVRNNRYEPISNLDVKAVLDKMHVSVTNDELRKFELFKEGTI